MRPTSQNIMVRLENTTENITTRIANTTFAPGDTKDFPLSVFSERQWNYIERWGMKFHGLVFGGHLLPLPQADVADVEAEPARSEPPIEGDEIAPGDSVIVKSSGFSEPEPPVSEQEVMEAVKVLQSEGIIDEDYNPLDAGGSDSSEEPLDLLGLDEVDHEPEPYTLPPDIALSEAEGDDGGPDFSRESLEAMERSELLEVAELVGVEPKGNTVTLIKRIMVAQGVEEE